MGPTVCPVEPSLKNVTSWPTSLFYIEILGSLGTKHDLRIVRRARRMVRRHCCRHEILKGLRVQDVRR